MMQNDSIRPLHDVWLRPRRVFRELAAQPVGLVDQMLGAAQGVMSMLGYFRAQDFGAKFTLGQIFTAAVLVGAVVGIAGLYLMAAIYSLVGSRAGGSAPMRRQSAHVLAYSSVPLAMALGIWVLTALIAGEVAFIQAPQDLDGFVAILLNAQFVSYLLLAAWSVVLQVMGFSEIFSIRPGKAFGVWVLGQLIAVLAILFLYLITSRLVPSG
jgi:hypothetical protein